ncbi:A/G-specific adenine glycosylase [bacterium]|nr:MAG: A/G-specific adenine glycosylase [bacterium]
MNDAKLTRQLETWFKANARDLPWRLDSRDPYHALVSECMLQQTQVSRVLEKYQPFIDRFPTVQSLAQAPEEEVLAMWAGLGYYRRARMLHACAQGIVKNHAGVVPNDVKQLEDLPGIGRYTAGAIASMVFHQREPIVDGNVTRVLLRLHNKSVPQTDKETIKWAWQRATDLVLAADEPNVLNEAMMELGATCCTPKNVRCDQCPLQSHCQAFASGTTESIPLPKPRAKQKRMYCATIVSTQEGSVLLEQRPASGMWANMFQAPTIERDDRQPTSAEIGEVLGIDHQQLTELGQFTHITTHRIVEFVVYGADGVQSTQSRAYRTLETLDQVAISNAQRKAMDVAGIL